MLDCAVLVHVTGHAQRGQVAHFVGGGNRAAEHEDRQSSLIELADRPDEFHAAGVRQPEVEDDQIDFGQIGAYAHEQLGGAFHGQRGVTGAQERGGKSIPHEGGIVSDDDGFGGGHGGRSHVKSYRTQRSVALRLVAEFIRFSL